MAVGTYLVVRPGSQLPIDAAVVSCTATLWEGLVEALLRPMSGCVTAHGAGRQPSLQAAELGVPPSITLPHGGIVLVHK